MQVYEIRSDCETLASIVFKIIKTLCASVLRIRKEEAQRFGRMGGIAIIKGCSARLAKRNLFMR